MASTRSPQEVTSSSPESGMDYSPLENLLRGGEWREANRLTSNLLLTLAGQEQQGYLKADDIRKLPCQDLQVINQLWVNYSNEHFGFSVQASMWKRIQGSNYQDSLIFEELVGWNSSQPNLIPDPLLAPEGHLPLRPASVTEDGIMDAWGGWWIREMPLRLDNCGIQY